MKNQFNSTILSIKTLILFFAVIIINVAVFMGCSKDNPISSTSTSKDTTVILQLDTFKFVLTDTNWSKLETPDISVYPDTMHVDFGYRILCDTNISLYWEIFLDGIFPSGWYTVAYGDTTGYARVNLKLPKGFITHSLPYKITFLLYLGNQAQAEMRLENVKIWYMKKNTI